MKKLTTIKSIAIILIMMFSISNFAQKLEKIKGSKIVTLTEISLDSITSIELYKDIDLILKQSDSDKLTIYADDNLHDVVDVDLNNGKLSLSLNKRISSKKKFELTLFVKKLSEIILDDDSTLTNSDFYEAKNLNITLNNKSVLKCLLDADSIILEGNDSSKSESSFKTQTVNITLQDRAKVKGNLTSEITKINLNNRASLSLSGKSEETYIDAKDSADVKVLNMPSKITEIIAEDKTSVYTKTNQDLTIIAKGSAKVYIYGKPEIDLIEFKDKASLFKKE